MSSIALSGSITLIMKEDILKKILLPLVAFAAGSLIGGAFFHMLPVAIGEISSLNHVFLSLTLGFVSFLILEQFMHWHHCHRKMVYHKEPVSYLILIADGLHNFLGGLAIGGIFMVDIRLGITAWFAAAAHEVPQELGDFGVLVQGGWSKRQALMLNFLSGLTFLVGGMTVYFGSSILEINTNYLIPFGAGNFIYIAASDLIPLINKEDTLTKNVLHFGSFLLGLFGLYALAVF